MVNVITIRTDQGESPMPYPDHKPQRPPTEDDDNTDLCPGCYRIQRIETHKGTRRWVGHIDPVTGGQCRKAWKPIQ